MSKEVPDSTKMFEAIWKGVIELTKHYVNMAYKGANPNKVKTQIEEDMKRLPMVFYQKQMVEMTKFSLLIQKGELQ